VGAEQIGTSDGYYGFTFSAGVSWLSVEMHGEVTYTVIEEYIAS